MDGRVFYDRVAEHGELEWLGVREGSDPTADEVYVGYGTAGAKLALPVETILSREWDEIEAVLTGKRQARVLTHLTRIVGYFSQVHNWNRSKHTELADRGRGGYVLPERLPVRTSDFGELSRAASSAEPQQTGRTPAVLRKQAAPAA